MANISQFFRRFGGVSSVAFLTYLGEYMSFLVVLAFVSDKLTISFGLGLYGYALIGTISGVYLVLSGVVAIPIGHLCDKYGRRLFTILGSLLGASALFSLVAVDQLADLTVFSLGIATALGALGLGHGTYTASTLAYTGDVSTPESLGKPYGLVELAEFAAYAFGPSLGGVIAFALGRTVTFAISGVILLAATGIAAAFMPESGGHSAGVDRIESLNFQGAFSVNVGLPSETGSRYPSVGWRAFLSALEDSVVAITVLTTFVGSLAFSAFFYYVPLYAYSLRSSAPVFGIIYPAFASLVAGTGVILMIPFGHLEDSTKRRMPLLVAGLLIGAASLGFVFVAPSLAGFIGASIIFGASLAMIRVSQLVILAERTGFASRAAVMGTNHAIEHTGYGVGALVGGVAVALYGLGNTFRGLSGVLLIAAVGFFFIALLKKLK